MLQCQYAGSIKARATSAKESIKMRNELKEASENLSGGCTCSQAVFCVYAKDMGLTKETAGRMMEGFGCGCGGMQELCGALAAAFTIISYYYSDGKLSGCETRKKTFQKIQQASDIFRNEYGGINCRDIYKGDVLDPCKCEMKIKDIILILNTVLKEARSEKFEDK